MAMGLDLRIFWAEAIPFLGYFVVADSFTTIGWIGLVLKRVIPFSKVWALVSVPLLPCFDRRFYIYKGCGWLIVAFYDSKVRQHFRLSHLDCLTAKPDGAAVGGRSPFILPPGGSAGSAICRLLKFCLNSFR